MKFTNPLIGVANTPFVDMFEVVIQLAVFKGKGRAQALKDQLAKKYYDIPFLVDENQQNTYQVIAGPYNVRSKAVQIANALKSDGVNNFVRSYRK